MKELNKRYEDANRKATQLKGKYGRLEEELKNKSEESDTQFEHIDKVKR